jgi:hypothetical protein
MYMQVGLYLPHYFIPVIPNLYNLPTSSKVGRSVTIIGIFSFSAFFRVSSSGSRAPTKGFSRSYQNNADQIVHTGNGYDILMNLQGDPEVTFLAVSDYITEEIAGISAGHLTLQIALSRPDG